MIVTKARNNASASLVETTSESKTDGRLRVLSTWDEFTGIQEIWNGLLTRSDANCPFLRHEWLVLWWQSFKAGARLHILLWENENRLLGAAPLMLTRRKIFGIPATTIEFLANGHSFRCDVVVEQTNRLKFLSLLNHHFTNLHRDWDLIWLRDIPQPSGTVDFFSQNSEHFPIGLECPMSSPYIRLEKTWQDYFQARKAHFRANLRRRYRQLSKLGKVAYYEGRSDNNYMRLFDDGLKLEASGWKGRTGSAISNAPETERFYINIAKWAAEKGWLKLYFLFLDNKQIAFDFALDYGGCIYLLKIGYDQNYSRFSPGQLLKMNAIESAYASGRSEYDFLGFDMPWKLDWATGVRVHRTVALYGGGLLPRGYYFWQHRLLPMLRNSRTLQSVRLALRKKAENGN